MVWHVARRRCICNPTFWDGSCCKGPRLPSSNRTAPASQQQDPSARGAVVLQLSANSHVRRRQKPIRPARTLQPCDFLQLGGAGEGSPEGLGEGRRWATLWAVHGAQCVGRGLWTVATPEY